MKKVIVISIIILLVTINTGTIIRKQINNSTASLEKNITIISSEEGYGLIIPVTSSQSKETRSNIAKTVNDLLRAKIIVYWLTQDLTTQNNNRYLKGSHLIPFTGDTNKDSNIKSITRRYNIEVHDFIDTPNSLKVYSLNEPKIATICGGNICNWYPYTLQDCGFNSIKDLTWAEIPNKLKTTNYNVFIWPGGDADLEQMFRDQIDPANKKALDTIRNFVSAGGGYIGSCYGAYEATHGFMAPVNWLKPYLPNINSYPFLSLANCYSVLAFPGHTDIKVKITDTNSPVCYALPSKIDSYVGGGPMFFNVKGTTKAIGTIQDPDLWSVFDFDFFKDLSDETIDQWVNYAIGKSIWATSSFGEGRTVIFGDHPESSLNNNRVISNAVFYACSEGPFYINPRDTPTSRFANIDNYLFTEDSFIFRLLTFIRKIS